LEFGGETSQLQHGRVSVRFTFTDYPVVNGHMYELKKSVPHAMLKSKVTAMYLAVIFPLLIETPGVVL